MGQRANLIIVQHGQYLLYYSHWCANTLPRDLFWGPAHSLEFIHIQRKVDESGWLDNVWAEGGAVIDCDNRLLLLYGGEDILHDVPLRRVYLQLLRRAWEPWDVRWAYEGIAEIADYVGYPRAKILTNSEDDCAISLAPPEQPDWTDIVGSFRLSDNSLRLFPLAGDVEWYLFAGPNLARQCCDESGVENLPLDEWLEGSFPIGGFHIELAAKTIDYWTAEDMPGVPDRVSAAWPGWCVRWHRDKYEVQLQATADHLRFPLQSEGSLLAQLREMLLRESGRSVVGELAEVIANPKKTGREVQVNPWALRDDRLELPLADRQRVLDLVLQVGARRDGSTAP